MLLPRIGLREVADRTRARRVRRTARRFHDLAIELGGLMIKGGPFMSSRLDVLAPEITRNGLRNLLFAVASRDSMGLVAAIEEVGMLLPSAGTAELERAMTEPFKRFSGMGLAELRNVDPREFQDFAEEFGDVVRNLPFQLPEHFLLLIRAVSVTSGVCSGLDPKFNVWDVVEPYVTQLVRDEAGNLFTGLASQTGRVAKTAWGLPQRIDQSPHQTRSLGEVLAHNPLVPPKVDLAAAQPSGTGRDWQRARHGGGDRWLSDRSPWTS